MDQFPLSVGSGWCTPALSLVENGSILELHLHVFCCCLEQRLIVAKTNMSMRSSQNSRIVNAENPMYNPRIPPKSPIRSSICNKKPGEMCNPKIPLKLMDSLIHWVCVSYIVHQPNATHSQPRPRILSLQVASETLKGMFFFQDYSANMQSTRVLLRHRL